MQVTFRQGSEEVSQKLKDRAEAKLQKLSRFVQDGQDEPIAYVDIERDSNAHEHAERLWRVSVNVTAAGEYFNASSVDATPEKGVDGALRELVHAVRKAKGRKQSILRRGQNMLKRLRRSAA